MYLPYNYSGFCLLDITSTAFIAGMILLLLVLVKKKEKDLSGFLHMKKLSFDLLPVLFIESLLLILSASFVNVCSGIFFANGAKQMLEDAVRHPYVSLITLCLFPAVSEELLFRGIILRSIRDRVKGLILSSVLFAIWHLNPNQMSYAFLAGLLLGTMALWTDNLVCCMITHFLFNLYNLLASVFTDGSPAGKLMSFLERIRVFLISPLQSPDGLFLWHNFIRGFLVFAASTALYLCILWRVRKRSVT